MFGSLKKLFGEKKRKRDNRSAGQWNSHSHEPGKRPHLQPGDSGKGTAVIPSDGRVVAPADGLVTMVFDTKHAISMQTDNGAELIIHIGLDTVQLKGQYFDAHVAAGDKVKAGRPPFRL